MDLQDPNRWRFTSQNRRFKQDEVRLDASNDQSPLKTASPSMDSYFPRCESDVPHDSSPLHWNTHYELSAPMEERIKVVIGGRAYILNSTRDRATILAIASEADHLLEHLKLTHGNLSEVALSILAVANVLDQKNQISALYEAEKKRAEHLEERLESVYQSLSKERYLARSKPRSKSKKGRKSAPRRSTTAKKQGSSSSLLASAQDLAEDENALEEAQQSLADYLARIEGDEL